MAYGIATTNGYITAEQIIARLNPEIALHAAHIQAIRNIMRDGERYSFHASDVCSAAATVAHAQRSEIRDYEAGWVRAMLKEAGR